MEDPATSRQSGRVTISRITREAGVSLTTISRALNDRPDIHTEARRDHSAAGFDDLELAACCCPALTMARPLGYDPGQRAMHILLQLITGKDDAQAEIPASELVIRETTGPALLRTGEGQRR